MEWRARYPASNLTSSQPLVRHHSYFYAAPYAGLKRIDVSITHSCGPREAALRYFWLPGLIGTWRPSGICYTFVKVFRLDPRYRLILGICPSPSKLQVKPFVLFS